MPNLEPLFQSFESGGLGNIVRQSIWLFPVIECFHLLALSLLGGTVIALNLRMLGLGLRTQTNASLARMLHPWLFGALAGMLATGIPMFLSEAVKCYFSPPFWYKMGFLLVATIFTFTIHRRVLLAEPGRVAAPLVRLTAVMSLALWFGVGFSGRWIAFY